MNEVCVRAFLIGFLLFPLSTFAMGERPPKPDLKPNSVLSRKNKGADPSPVILQIGNAEYALPNNILRNNLNTECNQSIISFVLQVPEMIGRTEKNTEIFKTVNLDKKYGFGLINYLENVTAEKAVSNYLNQWIGYVTPFTHSRKHGLYYWIADEPDKPFKGDDIFTDNPEKPSFVLHCTIEGSAVNPGCRMYTGYKNNSINFHFNRIWLAEWKQIYDGLQSMMKNAYIAPVSKPKPNCINE